MTQVSIIIPAFKFPSALDEVLIALSRQQIKPNEVIVIDSSPDNSVEEIVEHHKIYLNLVYVKLSRAFPGEARNAGIDIAKYKFIGFLDSKTPPKANWLANAMSILESEEYDVFFGSTEYIAHEPFQKIIQACSYGKDPVETTPGTVISKTALNFIGKFFEGIRASEDLEWRQRIKNSNLNIYSPKSALLTYPNISRNLFIEAKRHFLYQLHTAYTDVQGKTKMLIFGLSIIFGALLIPQWNNIVGWDSILFIPYITRSYFYLLCVFILSILILRLRKKSIPSMIEKSTLFSLFIVCSYLVWRWNANVAGWVETSIYYIPHISKIFLGSLIALGIFFRGIYIPLSRGIVFQFLFPLRWIYIGFVGFILDCFKIPGYFLGAILSLSNYLKR